MESVPVLMSHINNHVPRAAAFCFVVSVRHRFLFFRATVQDPVNLVFRRLPRSQSQTQLKSRTYQQLPKNFQLHSIRWLGNSGFILHPNDRSSLITCCNSPARYLPRIRTLWVGPWTSGMGPNDFDCPVVYELLSIDLLGSKDASRGTKTAPI